MAPLWERQLSAADVVRTHQVVERLEEKGIPQEAYFRPVSEGGGDQVFRQERIEVDAPAIGAGAVMSVAEATQNFANVASDVLGSPVVVVAA
jgi:hypothetical protein